MDPLDATVCIAQSHGCRGGAASRACRFRREEDAMDPVYYDGQHDDRPLILPCFHIWRDGAHMHATPVAGSADGHDNAPRLDHICAWIERRVLPHMSLDAAVAQECCGYYRIELHDSYSYLSTSKDTASERYRDAHCLTFARDRTDRRASVSLLPDPFQMDDYGGMLSASRDVTPWSLKTDSRVVFAGSTTGDRDPARNERVRACLWSLGGDASTCTNFRLTNVVQMERAALMAVLGPHAAQRLLCPVISPADQFRHRYIANIVGNTCCWSRVPLVLSSNSVLFNVPHRDVVWYSVLMHADEHFVDAPLNRLVGIRQACEIDPRRCERIVESANRFAQTYLNSTMAAVYTRALFETMED